MRSLLLGLLLLACLLPPPPVATAAPAVFDLYGRLSSPGGWGFTADNITSPGPSIQVNLGEAVTLHLFSADGLPHTFFLDYNGNNRPDSGEPESGVFSSPTLPLTFSFTASRAGSFTYWCGIHFSPMEGPWTTVGAPANEPPTVAFTSPQGTPAWSGGSAHPIAWTMADAEDGAANLRVWLNATVGASTLVLVDGEVGTSSYSWTVPHANGTATLRLTAVDTAGAASVATAAVTLDASRPEVVASGIAYGGGSITVAFTEPMAPVTSADAFGLLDLTGSTWIPLRVAWNGTKTGATLTPGTPLAAGHTFRVYVNGTLRDASDPGNPLAREATYDFALPAPPALSPAVGIALAAAIAAPGIAAVVLLRRRGRRKGP